ncbi:MAG: helix-turn-helix domain-containing protein [Propionibacteriaceae bacterium]
MARGEFITGAAAEAGRYRAKGRRWLRESGGVRPRRGRDLKGRCLRFAEREEIAIAHARGEGVRQIAQSLGRSPSTVCRELQRNVEGAKSYRATLRVRHPMGLGVKLLLVRCAGSRQWLRRRACAF